MTFIYWQYRKPFESVKYIAHSYNTLTFLEDTGDKNQTFKNIDVFKHNSWGQR